MEEVKNHKGKVRVLKNTKTKSRVQKKRKPRASDFRSKLKASNLKAKPKPSTLKARPRKMGISDDIMGIKRSQTKRAKAVPKPPPPKPPLPKSQKTKKRPKILKSIPRPRVTTTKIPKRNPKPSAANEAPPPQNPWPTSPIRPPRSLWPPTTVPAPPQGKPPAQAKPHGKPPAMPPPPPKPDPRQKPCIEAVVNSSKTKDPRLEKGFVKPDSRHRKVQTSQILAKNSADPRKHPSSLKSKMGKECEKKRGARVRFKTTDGSVTLSPESSPRRAPDPASRKPTRSWENTFVPPTIGQIKQKVDLKDVLRREIEKQLRERQTWTCVNMMAASMQKALKDESFMDFLNKHCADFVEFDTNHLLMRYASEPRKSKVKKKITRKQLQLESPWFCLLERGVDVYPTRDFSGEPSQTLPFCQLVNIQEKTADFVELGFPHHGFSKPFACVEAGLVRRKHKTDTYQVRERLARSDLLGISIFRPTDRVTGHWMGGSDDGADDGNFWLQEKENGEITGFVDDPKKSNIKGKRTGNKINIAIKYKSKTKVNIKGKLSSDRESISMNFVCIFDDNRHVSGSKEIQKQALGKLTGLWEGGPGKECLFHLRHYECGLLVGYQYKQSWCKILGTVKNDKFIFKQVFGKESWVDEGDVSMSRGILLSDDVMEVSYAMVLGNLLRTGTNVLKRKG